MTFRGIWTRRPVVGLAEHLEVDRRVLVAGEAEEADLAVLQGLEAGVDGPVLGEDPVGVVVVDDLVELPEVEVVGLEPAEAVLQVRLGLLGGPAADLGHEEDLVAAAPLGQGLAHPLLGDAVVVVPAVVHEGDAFVDGPLDQPEALLLILVPGAVVAAEARSC